MFAKKRVQALPVRRFVLVLDRYAEASYHCCNHCPVVVVAVDFYEAVAFDEGGKNIFVHLAASSDFHFADVEQLALLVEFEFVGIDEKFFVLADESLDNHFEPRLFVVYIYNIHTLHTKRKYNFVKISFTKKAGEKSHFLGRDQKMTMPV